MSSPHKKVVVLQQSNDFPYMVSLFEENSYVKHNSLDSDLRGILLSFRKHPNDINKTAYWTNRRTNEVTYIFTWKSYIADITTRNQEREDM